MKGPSEDGDKRKLVPDERREVRENVEKALSIGSIVSEITNKAEKLTSYVDDLPQLDTTITEMLTLISLVSIYFRDASSDFIQAKYLELLDRNLALLISILDFVQVTIQRELSREEKEKLQSLIRNILLQMRRYQEDVVRLL